MDKMTTIAGVVLTLNEEQDLARALRSLEWCDELLVVDSGSTDQTCQVAYECGAQFLQHIQPPPFLITEQRNWALDKAGLKSQWVLFLDADEQVSPELAEHIRSCINSSLTFSAYELTPRYWFFGQWLKLTQGYPNWHPRLVKRGYASYQGGVWESFDSSCTIGRIYIPYEHFAFSKGMNDWLCRHIRYSDWEAMTTFEAIDANDISLLQTSRKIRLRRIALYFWRLRPLGRFLQKYILQGGFIEGWQSLVFSLLSAFYDMIVVIKVIEIKRRKKGQPL